MTKNNTSAKKQILPKPQKFQWRGRHTIIVFILCILGWALFSSPEKEIPKESLIVSEKINETPVFVFGEWVPQENKEILGTLESSGDIKIVAETSGIIEIMYKEIGDTVKKGDPLIRFQTESNIQSIQYQNAQSSLQQAQSTANQSILSAEIALENAKTEVRQIQQNESQNETKNWEILQTNTINSESTIIQTLNWADEILGASERYRYKQEATKRYIGNNDVIQRQNAKTKTLVLIQKENEIQKMRPSDAKNEVIAFAEARLTILKETQDLIRMIDVLIRTTNTSDVFSEANRSAFQGESKSMISLIDNQISGLKSALEGSKAENNRGSLSRISAENRVKNAEASLELTKANAQIQITNALNQLKTSELNQQKMTIRAPFDGVVTEKHGNPFSFVTPGQVLYSILSNTKETKVIGFISEYELQQIQNQSEIKIEFKDKTQYIIKNSQFSYKIDPSSQKIRIELIIEEKPENVLIGGFVKILIPFKTDESQLIPISSISFEPTGAEVLILDENNKATRRKIEYDTIQGNNVLVTNGIEDGETVIQFRKRVYAGELIKPKTQE